MNDRVNKFLAARIYIQCLWIIKKKTKKEYKNLRKQEIQKLDKLDKARFQYDMVYRDFKDLTKRTDSNKIFRDKAFNIAKNPNYDGYKRGLASMM